MRNVMKKSISLFLAMLMLISCFAVSGVTAFAKTKSKTIDGIEYLYEVKGKNATILDAYDPSVKKTTIKFPSKISGKKVVAIGKEGRYAVFGSEKVKTIVIPDTVTTLAGVAEWSEKLQTVKIGKGVKSIVEDPFPNCPAIKKFEVHKSNKYFTVYKNNLYNKKKTVLVKYATGSKTKTFTLPKSVKTLGKGAFSGAKNLKTINMNSNITKYPNDVFYYCSNLSKVSNKGKLSSIGSNAFAGTKIKSITVPKTVTSIGYRAFSDCSKLSTVDLSKTKLKTIGEGWFSSTPVKSIKLPSTVKKIKNDAFLDCPKLTEIKLPKSVEKIEQGAFGFCSSLKNITIPSKVTAIYDGTFISCTSLEKISIPKSVTKIGNDAFYECTKLKSISIPDSVKTIGKGAFVGCTSLTSVKLPKSLTKVSDYLFNNCTKLKSISIPDSVKTIGEFAFYGCTSLTSVKLPKSLEKIEYDAFSGCNIKSIVLPASLVTLQCYVFGSETKEYTFLGKDTNIEDCAINGYEDTVIIAPVGSKAEAYAVENGIQFKAL